jgi:hypothetical protein
MKTYHIERGSVAAATLTVPLVVIAWLLAVPSTMSTATFASIVALAIGAGAVVLKTWWGGQAQDTIGQVINDTETRPEHEAVAGPVRRD